MCFGVLICALGIWGPTNDMRIGMALNLGYSPPNLAYLEVHLISETLARARAQTGIRIRAFGVGGSDPPRGPLGAPGLLTSTFFPPVSSHNFFFWGVGQDPGRFHLSLQHKPGRGACAPRNPEVAPFVACPRGAPSRAPARLVHGTATRSGAAGLGAPGLPPPF